MEDAAEANLDLSFDSLSIVTLQRQLSSGSQRIYDDFNDTVQSNEDKAIEINSSSNSSSSCVALLLALSAIKSACCLDNITMAEKSLLKNHISTKKYFPPELLAKLSLGDRTALINFQSVAMTADEDSRNAASPRDNTTKAPSLTEHVSGSFQSSLSLAEIHIQLESASVTCCICGDVFSPKEGITCTQSHFVDSGCLTLYVSHINSDRENNSQLFHKRQGRVPCPQLSDMLSFGRANPCPSPCYGSGELCMNLKDPRVTEAYIDGLQHIQALSLFAEYQAKILSEIDDIAKRGAAGASASSSPVNREEGHLLPSMDQQQQQQQQAQSSGDHLAAERARIELRGFADSLRAMLPDARMCKVSVSRPVTHFCYPFSAVPCRVSCPGVVACLTVVRPH